MDKLVIENKKTITSVELAELTGKRHHNLIRSIRKMEEAWVKIGKIKFDYTPYTDTQGKKQPMYTLSKTETLYIATKFNDEARAKLILRWEALEKNLMEEKNFRLEQSKYKAMLRTEQRLIENGRKLDENREELMRQRERIKALEEMERSREGRLMPGPQFYTISGYARMIGTFVPQSQAIILGKIATKLCKERGLEIEAAPHPDYGTINMYPFEVLQEVFKEFIN